MLGDGTRTHATRRGDLHAGAGASATRCSPPSSPPATRPARCSGRSSSGPTTPAAVARRLRALAARYPGLRVSDRASLASASRRRPRDQPLARPAVRRDHLRLHVDRRGQHADDDRAAARPRAGAPAPRRRAPAARCGRWRAGRPALIIAIGLGLGLAIAATALLPLSHALTGSLRPYVPAGQLAAILGVSALLALLALALPTRRALRSRPVEAIGLGE